MDSEYKHPPIEDKVKAMLVNNPQPQSFGVFTESDRKLLQETHDGVTRLIQWKEEHEKNEGRIEARLNDHSNRIGQVKSSLDTWKGTIKTVSLVGLISAAIGGIILFIIKFIP